MKKLSTAALLAVALSASPLAADTLRVGLAAGPSSLDPHFHNIATNNAMMRNVFDRLVHMDANMRLVPALAESWTPIDETTWEIKLRAGVTFHDGTDFEASDVIYSVERIPSVPNSPSAFTKFVKSIEAIEVVDDLTLRIKTSGPVPLLASDLAQFSIVSKQSAEAYLAANPSAAASITEIDSAAFNSGALAIGTGPFSVTKWAPEETLHLARNDAYWGDKPHFEAAELRPIQNDAARLAALQSGDVDLIDALPTSDAGKIREDAKFTVFEKPSNLAIYLHMDTERDDTPFVTANDGSKIQNPLKDVRVREALSLAINREGIARAIMDGAAKPAGQLLDVGFAGASENLPAPAYDANRAKELLTEAGFPEGFKITLQTSNDRYVNDEKVALAIAQNLTRIGITTAVQAETKATYFGNASKQAYSFMLLGWGSSTGEQGSSLEALLHSYDEENASGSANRGRFSDAKFDGMITEAMQTLDEAERNAKAAAAAEYGIGEQHGLIPIHFQNNLWAARKGITFEPRADAYTIIDTAAAE
ncbi:ABC transporter substrate-binding protein [Xinfangfangia sp. CPCC 101601]|uniref:ABC transporter substrate-binding protein n=1 Tax=Pseudogemmobacter lacusdianii TaxID=3069608 RepID=A0ABU0W1U5_9RHOB|nr:ABC transporter substrate-binding protein [Xinfangfangia sp. CPCC 101601]MDQ2067941.1 ABC transporter substrate-binding protein [Xinfangfangia sp. CPCC 101601]